MTEDEDRIWLEALAGRAEGQSTAAREGRSLRAAILAEGAAREAGVPVEDPVREAELIARARRAGLFEAAREAPDGRRAGRWPAWFSGWPSAVLVAALAAGAVAIGLWLRPVRETQTETETVRSDPDGVVRLTASDPSALQRQLLDELRQAGVPATGYEAFGRRGVDADLPQPMGPDVGRVLARHRIPPPADGVLRVEIAAAADD